MADPTQTPDLQGAGLPAGQQDQSGLMDALRSQGSLPAMPGLGGPNPGLAAGSGMLAGLAGQTGNPYLAQYGQFQNQQFQQFRLMEQILENRRRAAERQEGRYDALIQTFRNSNDIRAKRYAAQLIKASAKRLGIEIPPAPLDALATMGDDERLNLYRDIRTGAFSPENLTVRYGITPDELKQHTVAANSDVISRRLSVPTKNEDAMKALELKNKTSDAWLKEHPEFNKDNLAIAAQLAKSRYGSPLMSLSEKALADIAIEATKISDDKKLRLAEARARVGEQSQLPVGTGQRWLDLQTGALTTPTKQQFASNPGRYRTLSPQGERLYDLLPTAYPNLQRLDELIDMLLPAHGPQNIVNGLRGHASRTLRQDPNWLQFYALSADTNIELAASLSPGQFRSQLLTYLQHSVGLSTFDTQAGAHRLTHTLRTQIGNRLTGITAGGGMQSIPQMAVPGVSPQEQAAKPAITKEQYRQLLKKPGVTDAMIREKYQVQ